MNCIITIKIIDFLPKVNSIPYENYKCIFLMMISQKIYI